VLALAVSLMLVVYGLLLTLVVVSVLVWGVDVVGGVDCGGKYVVGNDVWCLGGVDIVGDGVAGDVVVSVDMCECGGVIVVVDVGCLAVDAVGCDGDDVGWCVVIHVAGVVVMIGCCVHEDGDVTGAVVGGDVCIDVDIVDYVVIDIDGVSVMFLAGAGVGVVVDGVVGAGVGVGVDIIIVNVCICVGYAGVAGVSSVDVGVGGVVVGDVCEYDAGW